MTLPCRDVAKMASNGAARPDPSQPQGGGPLGFGGITWQQTQFIRGDRPHTGEAYLANGFEPLMSPNVEFFERQQNPKPNINDLRNRVTSMVKKPVCAKFITALLKGAAALTGNPIEDTDPMKLFEAIEGQGGFIYGNTIRKLYGFDGGTAHGMISKRNVQVELPFPVPFRSYGQVNRRAAADYAETQTRLEAFVVLHELIHLAGKNGWYSDQTLAAVVKNMPGSKPPTDDITKLRPASDYWNGSLDKACMPR